jgi:transposase-like protein
VVLSVLAQLRDVEELMAERGLSVDHTTIWRWTQAYGPEAYRRLGGNVKRKSSTWHVDETFGALSSAQFRRVQVPPALE